MRKSEASLFFFFAPSRLGVRPLPLLPDDRLRFQISDFSIPPNPRIQGLRNRPGIPTSGCCIFPLGS
jgi:hypothetical protein